MKTLYQKQHGFTAILVVVILVLFALIGTYMATQVTTASLSATNSFLGMQAWFAARSGAEWGIHQAVHGASCSSSTVLTIADFSVTVTCDATAVSEGPDSYTVYNLTSTATRGSPGDAVYVYRTLNVSATDI